MYSVINVDISEQTTDFLTTNVLYQRGDTFYSFPIKYSHLAIIRGSSTVNGDSAHSNENLAKQKNYVSFYIRSIKINFEANFTVLRPITLQRTLPGYVVLFKLPYKDEDDIRGKLVSNRSGGMILYSHPENVLAYDIINF